MRHFERLIIVVLLVVSLGFAITPQKADIEPCTNIIGDIKLHSRPIPCLGESRSPW